MGIHCSDLARRPKDPERAPTRLIKVEGDVYNGVYRHRLSQRVPADPGACLQFLRFLCLDSFSHLFFRSLSALRCLSGVTALYIGTYFDVLMGGGQFSVHRRHGHPGPHLLTILYFDMRSVVGQLCSQIIINTSLHQITFVPSFNSNLGLSLHGVLLQE